MKNPDLEIIAAYALAVRFAIRLFKMQDNYESNVTVDVMSFLCGFFKARTDCSIETMRDLIHQYEAMVHGT